MGWFPITSIPRWEGPYLVFDPSRDLDRVSVQFYHRIDGWSNNYGITHWMPLPADPEASEA